MEKSKVPNTTTKKGWSFLLSATQIINSLKGKTPKFIKENLQMFTGRKSLQWIPRDLFRLLKKKYPHGHTEFYIRRGISYAKFPIIVCPIMVKHQGKRIEASIGLHPDPKVESFYLFNTPFPQENNGGAVIFEIQGGEVLPPGHGEVFRNVLIKWDGKKKLCPTGKDALLISLVYAELADLQFSGKYLKERTIPIRKVVTMPQFFEEDFKFIYDSMYKDKEPVS
ncbi:MAG: hypothetical protein QG614_575 [Patescibacteria group bacterium]|nr:hypothetical protein [Patescibacteria group bacterium]MDQ5957600.1 hypothetical protein [Patescibacteria group bacterium]